MDTYDLFIVRHAKSDWTNDVSNDFDRPLARRGEKSLPLMSEWLHSHNIAPALVLSSPAKRAKQTAEAIVTKLQIPDHSLTFDKRLYLADAETLFEVLAETAALTPPPASIMLVGHNPGLENLLLFLCADSLPYTKDGKLLTTGNIVQLRINQPWNDLGSKTAHLVNFVRPKELD